MTFGKTNGDETKPRRGSVAGGETFDKFLALSAEESHIKPSEGRLDALIF